MAWSRERKVLAAEAAPCDRVLVHADTRVVARPGWYQVVTPSAKGYLNEIARSELEPGEVDAAIDAAVAEYHAIGNAVKWVVGPRTRPADMGARLEARGFTPHPLVAMGAPTDLRAPPAPAIEARPVATEHDLERFVAISEEGYGMSAATARAHRAALAASLANGSVLLWIAWAGATPVGNAALVVAPEYGYLIGGLVLPAARGRGAYRALVAARLAALAARGIEYAVTHASEATSAPILARLGFEALYRSVSWSLPAPG